MHDETVVVWGHNGTDGYVSSIDCTNIADIMCGWYVCDARKNDGMAVGWWQFWYRLAAHSVYNTRVDLTNVVDIVCGQAACDSCKNDRTAAA